ncbi:MAG: Transcription elongation factor GreA [candidate division WS2 bacterium ADurb.Bin280]|uniref:Transcription elongation factor GreA n=1 Tax=candidate division WS2 bacterium ADurb.Bin280 TaxID=1852829 RepID=A0A1V5SDM5_9BACT|nr:MAG: Transcription elongation factor GreA [candidate division WS2 bacterium ADurb.Bin280]
MSNKVVKLTASGAQKLENELKTLKEIKRPDVIDRIKRAKEYGDLSENAEYEDARNEQSFIEGRIKEIEYLLKYAKVFENEKGGTEVALGSTVLLDMDGDKMTYEIVSSNEANPLEGKISNISPIGSALIGAKVGDVCSANTPGGVLKIKVLEIK